ncbi:hypothetical protein CcaverHIS002_0200300 [Cutaneotrichosporon cavernicola]|uniref:Phosphatidylinositol-specific phospholipase C X domain-containing protein n=1 Tax=Cutaneotrichosporon cavernicola TaxID=279322 RepID=A0AA48L1C4_9TREE|nr:uncharacterized protein CcaverHIS019_0200340 [Cutaneotrichosporon cavernicola]BEI80870.1 hypothetical protein CcaverHIS002_0200300 [Cutaneotrichosporon cavernicola]BEI88672.1 hypothetical protein CcaverHIS019_0200340 [Cutaneotrichosporon cavernicola]BEI96445.1 hypothetical protein CcaverHIS631_0200340 [Cutaneotrichosporon cavernicola]BEJ04218.1 hypothetical protein CcaverHIS641_0200350 [Cutaneotrichosporon cavernicola]
MTIRIIAPGRQVTAASANGNGVNISIDGHHFVVEANPGDNIQLELDNGSVDVPPPNDDDRRRGWRRLNANNALAYAVEEDKIVVLPACNMNNWMSGLPDDRALADLTIPGTHESAALFGGFISQCQNHDVGQQLQHGIRFFDIRLKAVGNELQTFHGVQAQNSTLRQQVEWIEEFLRQNPRETVILSIKQEQEDAEQFPQLVQDALSSGMWRFDENFPTLGEVRGKGIFFSRFGKKSDDQFPNGQGLKPMRWPDNQADGFDQDWHGTQFRIHDWYDTDNIADKTSGVTNYVDSTCDGRGAGVGPNHPMTIAFASAGKFPGAPPHWMASGGSAGGMSQVLSVGASLFGKIGGGGGGGGGGGSDTGPEGGVNARLVRWLLNKAMECRRPRAIINLDFYDETNGMQELIAALNALPE